MNKAREARITKATNILDVAEAAWPLQMRDRRRQMSELDDAGMLKDPDINVNIMTIGTHVKNINAVIEGSVGASHFLSNGTAETRIVGEVYSSNIMPGMTCIETEFGSLYMPDEEMVTIISRA